VGSLNPNQRTIALFSNAGPWVLCHRSGGAVVSTFPADANGSEQPSVDTFVPGDGERSTIDPDDFTRRTSGGGTGGFGTWSGTSFSAPILAGELAQALIAGKRLDELSREKSLDRAWAAVSDVVGIQRP